MDSSWKLLLSKSVCIFVTIYPLAKSLPNTFLKRMRCGVEMDNMEFITALQIVIKNYQIKVSSFHTHTHTHTVLSYQTYWDMVCDTDMWGQCIALLKIQFYQLEY